ncbi:MAG: nitrous oxide reductase family maturation protein NosD [Povalibacter sp.]
MAFSRRSAISVCVLVVLGVVAALAYWHQSQQKKPGQAADSAAINVTSGEDRGPGSLREALFIAASAHGEASITVQVPKVTLRTPLPPIVSSRGVRVQAAQSGAEIDASNLSSGPVFDVPAANVSIAGLHIRNCKGAGVLLRAGHFRMESTTFDRCDIGVDIAENANEVLLEGNRFSGNRIGVRFAGSNRNTTLVKNEFSEHRDAGIWAVRAEADRAGPAISVRENRFNKERIGILSANVAIALERNELLDSAEMAMQLTGTGAVARGNRVSRGDGMGIVAENSRGVVIENNEIDGLTAYGIMIKSSADALVRGNRVHNCGYGLAFVIGTSPSTAIDNTIIEPRSNGIDVIGDSPVLRNNRVLRPRALAYKVVDFESGGHKIRSQPFLEGNNFNARGMIVADGDTAPKASTVLSDER